MTTSSSDYLIESLKSEQGLPINTGSQKVHPKRMAGRFRTLKWWTASLWLIFFLGPYLRWNEQQAILLDIPARQFRFFNLAIFPQDVWILTFVLLFFVMLLILLTAVAGRVFCGFFCFQTVWTDLYMWIEERLEGPPRRRQQLDQAPWNAEKLLRKTVKHALWLMIAALTGVSFAAWFTDAHHLWQAYFSLQAHPAAWMVLAMFTAGTYLFAGFMREQVCFWLCPYARIQGVMYGENTALPVYDAQRGEPRQKLGAVKNQTNRGACVDCDLCVAVCPTGIDIRDGQQIGCITCGLCIDACDHVMGKLDQPKGLVSYKSLNSMRTGQGKPFYKTPLAMTAGLSLVALLLIIISSISHISEFSISVYHHRQPEFIKLSDGAIRNRYQLKIQNKTDRAVGYQLSIIGPSEIKNQGRVHFMLEPGEAISRTVLLDALDIAHLAEINAISFRLLNDKGAEKMFQTVFIGPPEKTGGVWDD
ncbi:MAG: cytochrome c oxidase accessory protein CcoG [Chromatiales bacterium]|nr:cytochrome c oxidase accessory protein CcoG [Chromatiales bacterium]